MKSRIMKSRIIFSSALIILLALFGACDKGSNVKAVTAVTDGGITQEIQLLCNEPRDSTGSYEIDAVCAEISILAYDQYIKTVKAILDSVNSGGNEEKLIRGAKVGREEIQQLADLLEADSTAVPYIMLAFKEDSLGVYTDMIFTIQSGDGSNDGDYKYFDFTQPCPTYCPKKYSKLSQ
ncbi:MAG: hypothetical protein ACI8YQ_004558 [Polaribacter sp.]|jgi:hypothetical protein